METQEILNKQIGTKETKSIVKPGKVIIQGVEIQTTKKDGTVMKSPLANIVVKHPEKEEPLRISKIKRIKNEKVEVTSLWCNLDEDGQIQKSSAIADLLAFVKVLTLNELKGKEIESVEISKEDPYLCLKAY